MTGSSPRCPLRYHSLLCIENHLYIVGMRPILNKELEFIYRSNCSDHTSVYSYLSVYNLLEYVYMDVRQSALFLDIKM